MNKALRPEEILADGVDFTIRNGHKLRKGSIAAIVANIQVVEDENSLQEEKESSFTILKELSTTWFALEMDKYMNFKNKDIQAMFNDLKKEFDKK